MRRANFGRPTLAFTLVEILAVLAVIAVLAAVIFPVFARVRDRARESACISNLRQIGQAFRMYMADYDNERPGRLYQLLPAYISAPELLQCGSDGTGNYGYLNSGITTDLRPWPYRQSYNYYLLTEEQWTF